MARAKILIVEDDINLLEGIRTVLELEKYTVLTAENGEQALHLLSGQPELPDLIVSDIMMPRMDGLQLLTEVRSRAEWLSIPFIFLTARNEKADVTRGKRLGVDDYLVKPFDADDLLIAIESRLERHKRLHEAHKEAQEEEVSGMKRKILTILNHEFRTPLTFLVAYTDMLNEQQPNYQDNPEAAMFLRGINVGALRLRRLIENFIHLVEMETGDAKRMYDLRKIAVRNLSDVLRSAHSTVFAAYPDRSCTIWVADNLPPIIGDPVYLALAVVQLLENAVKFSKADQPIVLGADRIGSEVVIWVTDHGRGIDAAERERIWESFYQINRQVYEDQGAGAGLPIVRGVVQLHSGRIDLESEPGKGSTFRIYLPVPLDVESVMRANPATRPTYPAYKK
ncbi:MAG: hybrid sensor histidine kinase/response regulator [Anaerolineae bacterium]